MSDSSEEQIQLRLRALMEPPPLWIVVLILMAAVGVNLYTVQANRLQANVVVDALVPVMFACFVQFNHLLFVKFPRFARFFVVHLQAITFVTASVTALVVAVVVYTA